MSRVFVAKDTGLNRDVVVKVLHSDIAAEVSSERFRREVQLAARLQHPHIVPLISSGEVEGLPYFLMPFISGESLRARIIRDGELPVTDAVRILRDIASAISHAHRHGIVHRDIKPENILLSEDFALVTDFGIAKALSDSSTAGHQVGLTTRGVALGTPAYMAPEQAAADPSVDQRADIYSFGVVAYEMLTGAPPFAGRSSQALMAAHAMHIPEPIGQRRPGIPPGLASVVMQCLEKRPSDRPQNAASLIAALESVPTVGSSRTETLPDGSKKAGSGLRAIRTRTWVALGIAALVLVSLAGEYQRRTGESRTSAGTASASVGSIAVLPLTNLSADSADEYFSDGMTDELASALSKIPNLNVASRTSAYAFKGKKDLDLGEVGKKLNVRTVVEGSVRRAGDKLRVYAQLTDIANGFVLWSQTFDGDSRDIFKFQDQIATSVADALRSRLTLNTGSASDDVTSHGTQNLRAFDLFMRGRYYWNRRGGENLKSAIAYFDAALKEDPSFARAYSGLAISHALLPEYSNASMEESFEATNRAAKRALELDSTLAEAHTALGLAYIHAWERDKAAEQYRIAISLEPRYPTAHQWLGEYWYEVGEIDSSLVHMRMSTSLDPLAPINASALGHPLMLAGRFDEAIKYLKEGIAAYPSLGLHHSMLAYTYYAKGDYAAAVREQEIAMRLDSAVTIRRGQLAFMYGAAGDRGKAKAILAELKSRPAGQMSPYTLVLANLGAGDRDAAFREMERAVLTKDPVLASWSMPKDPTLRELRADPRWKGLMERMKLPSQ